MVCPLLYILSPVTDILYHRIAHLQEILQLFFKKHLQNCIRAIIFCFVISLSGPLLGREALGWFVDMSAIGASMGFFFTSVSALVTMKRNKDGTPLLKIMAILGVAFSVTFMILQLVPIPGLSGVHFGKESYMLLVVWIVMGIIGYLAKSKRSSAVTERQ
jgi:hypothetical protein